MGVIGLRGREEILQDTSQFDKLIGGMLEIKGFVGREVSDSTTAFVTYIDKISRQLNK